MKIIDNQGKLFGKINVIDFLAVLFILFICTGLYINYKNAKKIKLITEATRKSINPPSSNNICLKFYVRAKDIPHSLIGLIAVGDKENFEDKNIGEILEINEVKQDFLTVDLGQGKIISLAKSNFIETLLKMKLCGELIGKDLFYKGKKLAINSEFLFITDKYNIICRVESFIGAK